MRLARVVATRPGRGAAAMAFARMARRALRAFGGGRDRGVGGFAGRRVGVTLIRFVAGARRRRSRSRRRARGGRGALVIRIGSRRVTRSRRRAGSGRLDWTRRGQLGRQVRGAGRGGWRRATQAPAWLARRAATRRRRRGRDYCRVPDEARSRCLRQRPAEHGWPPHLRDDGYEGETDSRDDAQHGDHDAAHPHQQAIPGEARAQPGRSSQRVSGVGKHLYGHRRSAAPLATRRAGKPTIAS